MPCFFGAQKISLKFSSVTNLCKAATHIFIEEYGKEAFPPASIRACYYGRIN